MPSPESPAKRTTVAPTWTLVPDLRRNHVVGHVAKTPAGRHGILRQKRQLIRMLKKLQELSG